jgi:hypothetical protein
MATMNKVEQAFHDLIISNLGNIRENGPSKTADRYKPSKRFASLNKKDAAIFKKLYNIKPKATYGNGEVALFWLWNYHESNLDENDKPEKLICKAGASGNEPDLIYNKTKIEVKSYPSGTSKDIKTNIGRFQGQEEFVYLVNQIFSIRNALMGGISKDGKPQRSVATLLFGYKELAEAAEQFCILRSALKDMEKEGKLPTVFQGMKATTDAWDAKANAQGLKSCTGDRPGGQHIATELIRYGIKTIMGDKPGNKGYMLNVVGEGMNFENKFKWHQIIINKMTTNESVLALGSGVTKVNDSLPIGSDYKDTQTFGFNGATFAANLFRLFPEGIRE